LSAVVLAAHRGIGMWLRWLPLIDCAINAS
jgi:hypothetical protein